MIYLTKIDPIAFSVGSIKIRWYSIAYIIGILVVSFLLSQDKRNKRNILYKDFYDDIVFYGTIGVLIGGRIGYVLFYNISYYIKNPLDILKIWNGGMSFHGGAIGAILAIELVSNLYKKSFYATSDIIVFAVPFGIFFGRIANFINSELYGRVTNVPWGVVFDNVDNKVRHPSQLYEAILEGLVLLILMIFAKRFLKNKRIYKDGMISTLFVIFYSILRFFSECFREPDFQIGYFFEILTVGQIFSIITFLISIMMFYGILKKDNIGYRLFIGNKVEGK